MHLSLWPSFTSASGKRGICGLLALLLVTLAPMAHAQVLPAGGATAPARPSALRMARSSEALEGNATTSPARFAVYKSGEPSGAALLTPAQAVMPMMPHAMPGMAAMPGMGAAPNGTMNGGSMPMAMMMTGETMLEMVTGACVAGIAVGAVVSLAAGPIGGSMLLTNSGIGCGLGVAATIAGMAGMMGVRAIANGP